MPKHSMTGTTFTAVCTTVLSSINPEKLSKEEYKKFCKRLGIKYTKEGFAIYKEAKADGYDSGFSVGREIGTDLEKSRIRSLLEDTYDEDWDE